ncbi:hypothetical protein QOZ95_002484 [Paenibacillus brasilensis]|uniref:Uncharacterized protein n=1 Tax=Paenibacillus brasilensis TaxID=128574 RepID=A0ABU0L138_9BACL|nr:hypothetical protein [Paenibacillus brasilensis]
MDEMNQGQLLQLKFFYKFSAELNNSIITRKASAGRGRFCESNVDRRFSYPELCYNFDEVSQMM